MRHPRMTPEQAKNLRKQAMLRHFRRRQVTHQQREETPYDHFVNRMHARLPRRMIYHIREMVLDASPCREYILLWELTPMLH